VAARSGNFGDLGLLGWFKYYGFFAGSVVAFISRLGLPLPLLQVALPIAISFFSFMAMSYVIDVYRAHAEPVKLIDFALYLCFFPHLIAGPIVRVGELVPQFATPRDPRRIEATRAFGLIAGGLLKKVLIADPISTQIVDPPLLAAPAPPVARWSRVRPARRERSARRQAQARRRCRHRHPAAPVPPWRHAVTGGHPLRLLVTGDSLTDFIGPDLVNLVSGVAPERGFVDPHDGTGLARPDHVVWSLVARQQVAADNPDVTVVLPCGNDFQNMVTGR
jgi:hypothetical protein